MSFTLPQNWVAGWQLVVTQCEATPTGGTRCVVEYLGAQLVDVTFDSYDLAARGFDGLRPQIETACIQALLAALRLAE